MTTTAHQVSAQVYVPAHTSDGHYDESWAWVPPGLVPAQYVDLDVVSAQVTMDESWAPYVQGSLTIATPADPATLAQIDPRRGGRVRVLAEQRFGAADTLAVVSTDYGVSYLDKLTTRFYGQTAAEVSAAYPGPVSTITTTYQRQTLAAWSTRYAGATLAVVSGDYGYPYNGFGVRPSTRLELDVGVRSRALDSPADEMVLTFATDEMLLQDGGWLGDAGVQVAASSVAAAVTYVLATIGAQLATAVDAVLVDADPAAFTWQPGQAGWDFLDALVQAGGLRLWCDQGRAWHLGLPQAPSQGPGLFIDSGMVKVAESLDRGGEWAQAVVVSYAWTDEATGLDRVRHDRAGPLNATKVLHLERDTPWAGAGAAAARLARAKTRGEHVTASAVSAYDVTPGQVLSVTTPSGVNVGYLQSVAWDFPADEMDVVSRELDVVDANAWAYTKPVYPWTAVAAGVAWTAYTAPPVP